MTLPPVPAWAKASQHCIAAPEKEEVMDHNPFDQNFQGISKLVKALLSDYEVREALYMIFPDREVGFMEQPDPDCPECLWYQLHSKYIISLATNLYLWRMRFDRDKCLRGRMSGGYMTQFVEDYDDKHWGVSLENPVWWRL